MTTGSSDFGSMQLRVSSYPLAVARTKGAPLGWSCKMRPKSVCGGITVICCECYENVKLIILLLFYIEAFKSKECESGQKPLIHNITQ